MSYETGKLFINTTLAPGNTPMEISVARSPKKFCDDLGNAYPFKVCHFAFDQLSLGGDLEIVVSGDASLSIQISGDGYLGSTIDISGKTGITPHTVQALADTPVVQSMNGVKALVVDILIDPRRGRSWGNRFTPHSEFGQNLWRW